MTQKFYRTKLVFFVLSDEQIPSGMTLDAIFTEAQEGRYVGTFGDSEELQLTAEEMATALIEAGSDHSFFEL